MEGAGASTASRAPSKDVTNQLIAAYNEGKFAQAIDHARALTAQYPDAFVIWNILGAASVQIGEFDQAVTALRQVTELNPTYADGFNNLAVALNYLGEHGEAIAACETAISLRPRYAEAYNSMGNILRDQGKADEAIAAYQKALALKPDHAEVHNNLGSVLKNQLRLEEAIACYEKALDLKPDIAEAHNNIGNILKHQGKADEAIAAYEKALALKPDYLQAYNNLGSVLKDKGEFAQAIAAYEKALALKPDHPVARALKLHLQAHVCDWSAMAADQTAIPQLGVSGMPVPPFSMLHLEDAPDRHRLRSENLSAENLPEKRLFFAKGPEGRRERLRIGYFSADFHNHATMYLMARVFALHDKEAFEVFAYSYGKPKQDEMRDFLIRNVDHFRDVREMDDMAIVDLSREDELDIAIDLKGFTHDARLVPFCHGLAPVQISYLGYPGTLGSPSIDYIIADPILIPEGKRQYYSEKIIYLPHTYQPTDNKREIAKACLSREDIGLPPNQFVFCCFNNNYKISPSEFDIWMRLLGNVEGSVFWLLKSNAWAERNLKREAEARGIKGERLIFAEQLPQAEHLARLQLADLFLDTFNYNAHTTASDALWAGLPVLTKLGQGFPARVAASLLNAAGLPELITHSEEAYEALALDLARHPERLGQIKSKLAANRLTQPLFDSEQYTRHLEAGYQAAYDLFRKGRNPEDIHVV